MAMRIPISDVREATEYRIRPWMPMEAIVSAIAENPMSSMVWKRRAARKVSRALQSGQGIERQLRIDRPERGLCCEPRWILRDGFERLRDGGFSLGNLQEG